MRRTLDPEAVKRAKAECEAQGITLTIRDDLAVARLSRSLFEKDRRKDAAA